MLVLILFYLNFLSSLFILAMSCWHINKMSWQTGHICRLVYVVLAVAAGVALLDYQRFTLSQVLTSCGVSYLLWVVSLHKRARAAPLTEAQLPYDCSHH